MIDTAARTTAFDYYASIGAALFPIPKGQKNPTGIVASWQKDYSRDPAQWSAWAAAHPDCNFGIVAFASNLVIVDIDTSGPEGRDEAWAMWCDLCKSWGLPAPLAPYCQSARGGWHVLCAVPEGVDPASLRQPDAIKKRINIRCQGFTVAAGSYYDGTARNEQSGHYLLLSAAPPHPAPAALIAHCTRAPRSSLPAAATGTRDRGDVAALLHWLKERDAFAAYEDWVAAGMALKLEFGDGGLDLWQITHDATVDGDTEFAKWNSFSTDAGADAVTIASLLDRAHKMGWRGSVRKSTSALFDGVAALAAASGASLSSSSPGGMPMLAGQTVLSDIGAPILAEFMASTNDAPTRPLSADYPDLPASLSGHALYEPMRSAIARIVAMAEQPKAKMARTTDALAILSLVHQDVFDALCRRIRTLGATVPDSKIKLAAASLADRVERHFVTNDSWIYDTKGFIESDNSDNVAVFLGIVSAEVRWNGWLERAEIRGFEGTYPEWTYIDDTVVAKLRTRGNRTKTRFKPGKDFFWESLLSIAQDNPHDPVLDTLARLELEWDGKPRLTVWLSATCGVPCDPYHQAVARNIVGGMVHRARNPGCKHDTMAVLFGPQGTGKSTLAAILALNNDWFTDSILLGDASKELVLSLAGKMVVEISEMGMRGAANPSHVKKMLSAQFDEGRTAYARSVTRRPRRNILIGTTNEDEPLADPTGNRRFLPVQVLREIDLAWLRENVAQLVGEAAVLDSQGISFDLPRSVWGDAARHQEAARAASDAEVMMQEWFTASEHTQRAYVLASDLVYITSLAGFRSGGTTAARGKIMKDLGFRQEKVTFAGRRTAAWVRGEYMCMADVMRQGTRYMVGQDASGRPTVTVRMATQGGVQ